MAHANIFERRAHVMSLLELGISLTSSVIKQLAIDYVCHPSAIRADLVALCKPTTERSIYTSSSVRRFVRKRDGNVCQYCRTKEAGEFVVEHIIPARDGGVAQPYNLVVACQSCNIKKGCKVWIPINFFEITADEPEWRVKILSSLDKPKALQTITR